MAEVIRRDESVLSDSDRIKLEYNLKKLEDYYPEHKTYAMDALCREVRETAAKLAKLLGYTSTNEYLIAYGFNSVY